jgi:hypothetical protein
VGTSLNGFHPVAVISDIRHFHVQQRLNAIIDETVGTANTPFFKLTALESHLAGLDVDTYTHLALQLHHAMTLGGVRKVIIVVYKDFQTEAWEIFDQLRTAQPSLKNMEFYLRRHTEVRKDLQIGRTVVVRCMDWRGSSAGNKSVAERVRDHLDLPQAPYVLSQAGGAGIENAYERHISQRHLDQIVRIVRPELIVLTTHQRCARMFGTDKDAISLNEQQQRLEAASLVYSGEMQCLFNQNGRACPRIREFIQQTDEHHMHGLIELSRSDITAYAM